MTVTGICFDDILSSVGNDGKYQKQLLYIFVLSLHLISSFLALTIILQVSVPDHWCAVPGKPENVSLEYWKNITIPTDLGEDGTMKHSSCLQYETPLTDFTFPEELPSIVTCTNGWEFDKTWYEETISTREQWVCENSIHASNWLSVGTLGNLIGTLICYTLSDIIGRRPVVILTSLIFAVFGILRVYVTSKFGIMLTMLIACMSFPSLLHISFILAMEQVSNDFRARTTFLTFVTWTIGMCALPLIAWLTRSWVYLGIVTSVPFFAYISIQWLLYESPRWLASQGRISEAEEVLKGIAKINGKTPPANLRQMLQSLPQKKKESKFFENSFIELLKYPTIRKRTILLSISLVCNNIIYYCLLLNNEHMVGNEFLNFFILASTGLPSSIVGWIFCQTIGRRMTSAGFIGICALAFIIVICLPASYAVITTSLFILAKFSITVSFYAIYLQFVEIYPTSHRSSGTGFSTIVASIVELSAPYVIYIKRFSSSLPFIILTIISCIGVLVALHLPETLGVALPQNIKEADSNLVSQKFWSYQGRRIKKRKKRGLQDKSNQISAISIISNDRL